MKCNKNIHRTRIGIIHYNVNVIARAAQINNVLLANLKTAKLKLNLVGTTYIHIELRIGVLKKIMTVWRTHNVHQKESKRLCNLATTACSCESIPLLATVLRC